jgi:hypothetical protein
MTNSRIARDAIVPARTLLILSFLVVLPTSGRLGTQTLPTQTSTLFSGSGNCAVCHHPGAPNTGALKDAQGNDISPVTLWRSTMMANALKDLSGRQK